MGRFIFDNFGYFLAGIMLLLCLIGIISISNEQSLFEKDLKECLADGHKEYECRALLKNNQSIPVGVSIIHMGGK